MVTYVQIPKYIHLRITTYVLIPTHPYRAYPHQPWSRHPPFSNQFRERLVKPIFSTTSFKLGHLSTMRRKPPINRYSRRSLHGPTTPLNRHRPLKSILFLKTFGRSHARTIFPFRSGGGRFERTRSSDMPRRIKLGLPPHAHTRSVQIDAMIEFE